jgi:PBP1b-binding outer membrane lipoprotein LpoB
MTKNIVTILLISTLLLSSCQQTTKQETKNNENILPIKASETNLLIGSWVEPNPINVNEVQGIKINEDGTLKSINMSTLVYKKWWKENDKLALVSESIGNGLTIIDTIKFEIIKLNHKELEIKNKDYTIKYKRQ